MARHNFPVKSYTYVNSEGYIMTLHRIPSKNQSKPVIYLQHGLLSNSATYVDVNVRSHAFFLSSLGYDVWLGNHRGVRDCKRHVSLSPRDPKFWNFTLDNLAAVDVRENLHLIANATDKGGSIIYLGHSMGTTLSYMYASRYPQEAQALLKGIISLSPIAFVDGIPIDPIVRTLGPVLHEDLPIFAGTHSGSASLRQLVQYMQILQSRKLQMFDFGDDNSKHYGQDKPPEYDLSKITLPFYGFYGLNDIIATKKNVERLYEAIGSRKKRIIKIPESDDSHAFNHLDFTLSKYLHKFLQVKLQQVLSDEF